MYTAGSIAPSRHCVKGGRHVVRSAPVARRGQRRGNASSFSPPAKQADRSGAEHTKARRLGHDRCEDAG